ncbi:MAG: cell division protein FtsZ [Myxococcales bacterium]
MGLKRCILARFIVGAIAVALAAGSACRKTEAGSCEFWSGRLTSETDELASVRALAEQRCAGASEALAAHLPKSRVPGEVVAALGALGPNDAARAALRAALVDERTAEAAARVLVEWRDPVDALRAALVAPGAERRRGALLDAALALSDGGTAALLDEIATVAAADPATQGMEVSRRAAALLAEGAGAGPRESRARLSALAVEGLLRAPLRADVAGASLRLALARLGLADPGPLVAALPDEAAAAPLIAEVLWDAGVTGPVVAHAAAVLRAEEATPRRLLQCAAASVALGASAEPLSELLVAAPHRRAEVADALGLAGQSAALWERFAAEAGASRAALVGPLALAIPASDLPRWETDVVKSPSVLVREAGEQAAAAVAALRQSPERPWVTQLQAAAPSLPALGPALAAARDAHDAARQEAEAAIERETKAFHAAEDAEGAATAEVRKAAMDALRRRRDELFAPLAPLQAIIDAHEAARVGALRALLGTARDRPEGAWEATAAVYEAAAHEELADLRFWAAVALERLAGPADAPRLREVATRHLPADTAVHLLAVATRVGR